MIINGRVFNLDCSEYIPDNVVDVWHADLAGDYDNVGFKLRGQMLINSQGFYMYETIKPGKYLNGADFRPSQIHYKVTPPGFNTLTTQLYFAGDETLPMMRQLQSPVGNSMRVIELFLWGKMQMAP